jgi:putative YhdH/YhfP family quinone oxidoreductase
MTNNPLALNGAFRRKGVGDCQINSSHSQSENGGSVTAFSAYVVRKVADSGTVTAQIETVTTDDLPPGEVLIRLAYSSLNYKDALAVRGHPGVVRSFPHVPGIDAAGKVEASDSAEFQPGDDVIVTGYELGAGQWGGFSEYVRVPADWVVRCPDQLSLRECMIYGTAGFTAAQAVWAICEHGITPASGPVVVTGATGGVGIVAVGILSRLGFEVVAVTGKPQASSLLAELGASRIMGREEVIDTTDRPLLSARWAASVDTVGGDILSTIVRQTDHRGCVTACGLVAGTDLKFTVYPFILRGVTLAGIDSAKCPMTRRREIWTKLASDWRLRSLEQIATEVTLRELPERVDAILRGQVCGRTVVCIGSTKNN